MEIEASILLSRFPRLLKNFSIIRSLASSPRALDRALSKNLDEPVIRQSKLNYFLEARPTSVTVPRSLLPSTRVPNSFTAEASPSFCSPMRLPRESRRNPTQDSKLPFIRFRCTLADISQESARSQKWTKSKLQQTKRSKKSPFVSSLPFVSFLSLICLLIPLS